MAVDYSQLQATSINSEQAKNLAELITTYMTIAPQTDAGGYDLTGLADLIQRNGLQAGVDWAKSAGADFKINRGQVKTPYPVAKDLVDRLFKDAAFDSPNYYQDWLTVAQAKPVEELIDLWNNAGHTNPTKARSKITPEEIQGFTARAEEELPKVIQSDLNSFIQSANKIYQGYDLTPNYGPEFDAKKLIDERLNQAGITAGQADINRWLQTAERYGAGAAIAQIDRALALRGRDEAVPTFAQGEGFEGIKLTGQLPSTYAGSSQYEDTNYAGTKGNPLLQQAQQVLVPATSVNPLVGTGSTTASGIPIQGVPQPTLPQTSAPTNIPIQGVPTPQIPSTSSFINTALGGQSKLPSLEAATPVTQGPRPTEQPMPQPMPTPSIFSSFPAPQPLVGTFGSQPLVPQPQIPVQQAPQPQMTNEEFIQQQQAPVQMADGGSVGGASSGVRRLKMSGYQDGGDVSENRFAQMMEDDQRAQDRFVGDINRQLSELITRYRSGDQGVTEKDLLPFFPGYSEYDIAQMYGTTTEAANPRMSEKINPFTVDMIPGIKGRGEAVQRDYDRMVREGRLLDPMMPKRVMTLAAGGDVSNDEYIQQMMTGIDTEGQPTSPVDTAVSDFISSRSKLLTDPKQYLDKTYENIAQEYGDINKDPKAMEAFLMDNLGFGGLTAYHGGSKLFKQFDPSKRGTGEGFQQYGVGSGYAAEARPVAEGYRRYLGGDSGIRVGNKKLETFQKTLRKELDQAQTAKDQMMVHDKADLLTMVTSSKPSLFGRKSEEMSPQEILKEIKSGGTRQYDPRAVEWLESTVIPNLKYPGYLYKGDIPDEIIPTFLDWDKPLSQQTKEVKGVLEKDPIFQEVQDPRKWSEYSGGFIQMNLFKDSQPGKNISGEDLYKFLSLKLESDQAATNYLDKLGLRGIRYLDEYSRGKEKGTSNFVVFRPEDYKVEEINDLPLEEWIKQGKIPGKAKGGEVSNDEYIQQMMTGTPPEDMATEPGLLPPELRKGVDVPLDLLNTILRGTAGAVGGPAYGLYKGVTSDKFGTEEGVKEARSEAERMMAEISGEPKTEEVRNLMEKLGQLAEEAKIPPLPQFLTTPAPGPGSASALMRSYELAETPPTGTVKLADKGAKPVATPPTDALGFYSPTEKVVMNLPQEKGTAQQMLAQISKAQGVKPVELRATGLEDYLKGKGNEPVTKQEIQDFLRNNPVQVDEVVLGKGQVLSPEAKQRMQAAEDRMMEIDEKLVPYFENAQGQSLGPYSSYYTAQGWASRLRGPLGRKAAAGDAEAIAEIDALNLPPEVKQLVLEFGEQKNEFLKYSKQARKMVKPKFDQYNTPGGENAREIYLTLPGEEQFKVPPAHVVSPEADTNRLAHIFLDDRTDAEGNKTLFVQELQSDWAQQGRDKGFKSPEELATKNAKLADLRAQFDKAIERFEKAEAKFNNRTPSDNDVDLIMGMRRANDEADLLRQEIVKVNTGGLPSAPFVTNTEDWLNLALKRVIKEAVDSGADNVAFIKGEQAAEKYSLSTVLDGIEVFPTKAQSNTSRLIELKQKGGGIIPLFVNEKGVVETAAPRTPKEFIGKSLSEIIGKEMSEKVMAAKRKPGKEESVSFEVEDLVVGGEGMKGFYDNILPKTAEKLLKRLGGGKVEPITMKKRDISGISGYEAMDRIGIPEDQQEMHWINLTQEERENLIERARNTSPTYLGFKITPEMREMVQKEGLPKFAAGGEVTDFIKRVA